MATHSFMFQYLKEKIDKGFPAPNYPDLIKDHSSLYIPENGHASYLNYDDTPARGDNISALYHVAMFFDGPFFPIRNGACYTIHNLMRALGRERTVDVHFFNCYRGWDEIDSYYDRGFSTTLFNPTDYYTDTGILAQALVDQKIEIAHFFDTEVLLTLAPLLQRLGIKIVLETQNIDHVLLERLKVPEEEINTARDIQASALRLADYNLFRSAVDHDWGLHLGATPENSAIYKGGIWVDDFSFKPREQSTKLVFLGHMFYQPNENALDAIVSQILPKLPNKYSLTVIGITPPKLKEKYSDRTNIVFMNGVDDLDDTLQQFDIALAPLLEGSGTRLKLLDYLASGLPVIATSIAAEGLNDEISAYITIEDDLSHYADEINTITHNIKNYQNRALEGRRFVKREYNWPSCVQPFLDAYKQITTR